MQHISQCSSENNLAGTEQTRKLITTKWKSYNKKTRSGEKKGKQWVRERESCARNKWRFYERGKKSEALPCANVFVVESIDIYLLMHSLLDYTSSVRKQPEKGKPIKKKYICGTGCHTKVKRKHKNSQAHTSIHSISVANNSKTTKWGANKETTRRKSLKNWM